MQFVAHQKAAVMGEQLTLYSAAIHWLGCVISSGQSSTLAKTTLDPGMV
jgi:hypothetical protein